MGLSFNIKLIPYVNKIDTKGSIVYEYNPLHNYRIGLRSYRENGKIYTTKELCDKHGWHYGNEAKGKFYFNTSTGTFYKLENGSYIEAKKFDSDLKIELLEQGEVVDFITEELNFDLSHPIQITPLYSYDNSVNLILNDGKTAPKLINTRFSALGKNEYLIVDRTGNDDTNLYNRGPLLDSLISLYKWSNSVARIEFLETDYNGNLSVGNYNFYIKYKDADGNESDFIAESGLVSLFIGNTPKSIVSGWVKENSHKLARFHISDLDTAYNTLSVYYTVSTSEIYQQATTEAYRIEDDFTYEGSDCWLTVTGFEKATQISLDEINLLYQIYDSAETQAVCQNRLFLGNVTSYIKNYEDLQDISLRFTPSAVLETYNPGINLNYEIEDIKNSYYNSKFIYDKTGYWDDDIYRFGIVYIYPNGQLSPVFNIRGTNDLKLNMSYVKVDIYNDLKERNFIKYNNSNIILYDSFSSHIDNSKGVVRFRAKAKQNEILGIKISVYDDVLEYLRDVLGIKGYFFVRLKRIPTTLCQAYGIGIDTQSYTPIIPYKGLWITETFVDKNKELNNRALFNEYIINHSRSGAAICPDYDVNGPYYNSIFTGGEFKITTILNSELSKDGRHFYTTKHSGEVLNDTYTVSIVSVEDNSKMAAIGDEMFAARAGEAEIVSSFEYAGTKIVSENAYNLLRGSYGPYLGLSGMRIESQECYFNIKVPSFSEAEINNYFTIRYNDKSPYYAISNRTDLTNSYYWGDRENNQYSQTLYRGDCYICQFTHRVNRNFSSNSAPTNDTIVDSQSWKEHWKPGSGNWENKSEIEKANLGDMNAVLLGLWITITVKSTYNLNIRALDDSHTDEALLFGHARGFYPVLPMSVRGAYKLPEALCYNKGFEKGLSLRVNFELGKVPTLKSDFTNRICYSDVQVSDAFRNGFRTFRGTNFQDYPKTYGLIVKLLELSGNLVCVFEHGVAIIPVNERVVAGSGSGGDVFINTNNILPINPNILSDTYGSQWKESIIKTPNGIYGIDTVCKKIWFTNGSTFKIISDFMILSFLNDNISLTEFELTPIIGVRNVKTHYNKNKGDVMFTFYDNLEGIEETAWNICWNEYQLKWITFYSWLPSYSENIRNSCFTFDRETSKLIAKLGMSKSDNDFSKFITVKDIELTDDAWSTEFCVDTTDTIDSIEFIRDPLLNYKKFEITHNNNEPWKLTKLASITDVVELHLKVTTESKELVQTQRTAWIMLIPKKKLSQLTTDFWKHGKAEIIDIKEEPKPTNWYGKQHPFEFEFVVADHPDLHKIFDNLQIIGNKAEPESFHFEIIGECYDFAEDKKNMYIRQEATKELYQYNGSNITYNANYKDLTSYHRPYRKVNGEEDTTYFDKSTLFPLYYSRLNTLNTIEDYYYKKESLNHDFSQMAGAELVYNKQLNEFRIWNHVLAVNMKTAANGRLRGNMIYKEDKWEIQINPINFILKNELDWSNSLLPILKDGQKKIGNSDLVPVELKQSPIPADLKGIESIEVPKGYLRGIVLWEDCKDKLVKIKDKYIKIRVRYSGKDLAIISALRTLYSVSYS